ncbi:MAG: alpha/beta fold hydrolase [Pseudomonadota bacterium]|nr:alpha/beta fold hydrolase [Pseudomonadota bacterium]
MGFVRNDAGDLIPPFAGEALPWIGGDLQTMRHFLRKDAPPPPPSRKVLIDLDDGDRLLAAFHPASGSSKGCVIAVHGLNGCMDAQHIWWLVPEVLAAGYSLLRVNMRGAGPGRALARGTYNAGAGADLIPFIDAAAAHDPGAPLFMMAHSLGGTAALNMALDFPDAAARLAGLITIGAPLDMVATARRFSSRRNALYVRYMLAGLKDIAATAPDLDQHYRDAATAARSIYEFDDLVTAPLAGYPDSAAYYAATSVHRRMGDLAIPTLILQGSNDPWVPVAPCLARPGPATRGIGTAIVVTRGGGHVGFHDRRLNWHIRATLAWCDAMRGETGD